MVAVAVGFPEHTLLSSFCGRIEERAGMAIINEREGIGNDLTGMKSNRRSFHSANPTEKLPRDGILDREIQGVKHFKIF